MQTIQDLRIVFMGTPEFAVASLDALVKNGCKIVGVITAPDKPAGRGMKLQESEVKKYASAHDLKILQPEKLKNPAFIQELSALKADVQVVVAFRMLPEVVWNMPPMGTINVHASMLPQYRGAAPINHAIIHGEKQTGITTFKLQQQIDTGNILLQQTIDISDDETAGSLHNRMKEAGAKLLIETLKSLAAGILQEQSQPPVADELLKHAPKITSTTCRIDWNEPAENIYNLIRGLSPYPAAFTFLNDKLLKVFKSEKEITRHQQEAGNVLSDNKTFLKFACADGFIHLTDLQLEGKKRMAVADFLRGYKIS